MDCSDSLVLRRGCTLRFKTRTQSSITQILGYLLEQDMEEPDSRSATPFNHAIVAGIRSRLSSHRNTVCV